MDGFVHVSVMAIISGLISAAIAFNSSILEFRLRALVHTILIFFRVASPESCVCDSMWSMSLEHHSSED